MPAPISPAKPLPFVPEGQELRFVQRLRAVGKWPLPRERQWPQDPNRPVLTPYLVVQAMAGDNGVRPLPAPGQLAFHNTSVRITDTSGASVALPVKGKTYTLSCRVKNLGNLGAFGGIAEFYIAPPDIIDGLAILQKPLLAAWGYEGFTARPGEIVPITSRKAWTPITDSDALSTIVVHAHDTFSDPVVHRFDGNDRHVGRLNTDFGGVWNGLLVPRHSNDVSTPLRLEITQSGHSVTIGIYLGIGGSIPITPQTQVSAAVPPSTSPFGAVKFPTTNISNTHPLLDWSITLTTNGLYVQILERTLPIFDGVLHR